MPINIDDSVNPAESDSSLNLIQTVNTLAYQVRKLTGKPSWKIPPDESIATIQQNITSGALKGDKGDKGDKGVDGISPIIPSPFLFFDPVRKVVTNTTASTQIYTFVIPGNTLSAHSLLRITALFGMTQSLTTKTIRCKIGNTDIFSSSAQLANYSSVLYQKSLIFRSLSSQVMVPNDVNSYSRYTNPIQEFSFNFAQDQILSVHVQPTIISDLISLEYIYSEILKA